MQNIPTKLNFKTRIIFGLVAVLCCLVFLFALTATLPQNVTKAPESAHAADGTEITASNFSTLRNATSGNYILNSNISISASLALSTSTFNGTFDGQGYTITINSGTYLNDFTADNDNYVGGLFGQINSGTVRNVKIVLNGNITARFYNGASSGYYDGGGSYANKCIYFGLVAGRLINNAVVENVEVEIGTNGVLSAIGIDSNSSAKNNSSGAGAAVGAFFGGINGAKTMKNLTLTNNGSIYARSQNSSAGHDDGKGAVINLTSPARLDKAAAGGVVGAVTDGGSNLAIENLVLKGSGYVGARAEGGSNQNYTHNINFAGGVIGYCNGDEANIAIRNILFSTTNISWVGITTANGTKYRGVLLGGGSGVTAYNLYRRIDDSSKDAAIATSTHSSTSSGPTKSWLDSNRNITNKVDSDISGVTCIIASVQITNLRQYRPSVTYNGVDDSTLGTAIVTDIKDGYLCIDAMSNTSTYIISAARFKRTATSSYEFRNYYTVESTSYTVFDKSYSIPASSVEFTVILATMSTEIYASGGDGNTKVYDTAGARFTGSTSSTSKNLINGLFWGSFHNTDASLNTYGAPNSAEVTTHPNIGTYTIKLCKMVDGVPTVVADGTSLGANQENGPSIIYKYDASRIFTCSITPAELTLVAKPGATFTKEYDGNAKVNSSDLRYTIHYTFTRTDTGREPTDTPEFSVGNGAFYNSSDIEDGSVGDNKTVKLFDINVTGNYTLSASSPRTLIISNCSITPRTITHSWDGLNPEYNGTQIVPTISYGDTIGTDTLTFDIKIYNKNDITYANPLIGTTYVGEYIVRARISNSSNYTFITGEYTEDILKVSKKTISLNWTTFDATFNYTNRDVTVTIFDIVNSVPLADRDKINITKTYYLDGTDATVENEVNLRNAGNYYAIGAIDNENYTLNVDSIRFDNIVISPISISVEFYTGSSSIVEKLPYMGYTYVGTAEGLHAKLPNSAAEYGLTNDNILLTYDREVGVTVEENVKHVGIYTARASLIETPNDADDLIISNYAIDLSSNTQKIEITAATITLIYSYDDTYNQDLNCFIYDDTNKSVTAEVVGKKNPNDRITVNSVITLNDEVVYAKNANDNYQVSFTLSNSDYVIAPAYKTITLKISPYDISSANDVIIEDIEDQTYLGTAITPTINIWYKGNLFTANDYYEPQYNNNTNAGTDTAIVTVTGKGNYTGNRETRFTILPRTLSVEFTKPQNDILTYNGKTQTIPAVFNGVITGDVVEPQIDYSGKALTPITIGLYTATVSFLIPQNNYILPEDESLLSYTFEIQRASVQLIFSGYSGLTFNNDYQTINVAFAGSPICTDDDGNLDDLKVTLSYSSPAGSGTPKNAASYTANATLIGNDADNYVISGTKSQSFSIDKFQLEISFINETLQQTYDAKAKEPKYTLVTPEFNEGDAEIELSYQFKSNNSSVVNPTKADAYIVTAKASNPNYMLVGTTSKDFVINPKELRIEPLIRKVEDGNIPEYVYVGPTAPLTIGHRFEVGYAPMSTTDENSLKINVIYVNANTKNESSVCIDVGTYQIEYSLPDNVEVNRNYYISNVTEVFDNYKFKITPRYITVTFNISGEITYNGNTYEITAESREVYNDYVGGVNVSGYEDNSGLVMDENNMLEVVNYVVETKDANGNVVTSVKNVGTYTSTVKIKCECGAESDNECTCNHNYVLFKGDNNKHPTVSTLKINKLTVYFVAKQGVSKPYGTNDNPELFIQELDSSVTGISGEESIYITLIRESGENVIDGGYRYYDFKLNTNEGNNNVDNFEVKFKNNWDSSEHGVFTITKKSITFTPKEFKFDYLAGFGASDLIQTYTDNTAFGPQDIKLQLYADNVSATTNAGTYNLKKTADIIPDENGNEGNYLINFVEDSHIGKLIILGRSITISFRNELGINGDFHITYGDADPDFYSAIDTVDVEKCDDRIKNAYTDYLNGTNPTFTWQDYISIVCVKDYDLTLNSVRPYKQSGYRLVISFLDADKLPDDNYRAVRNDGSDVNEIGNEYKLFVDKFDLGRLYGYSTINGELIKESVPKVTTSKIYNGDVKATITGKEHLTSTLNPTISNLLASQGFNAVAQYEDANAGNNKKIIIKYTIAPQFTDNYILPQDFALTDANGNNIGVIEPKQVVASFVEKDITLTYGEIPSVQIKFEGFRDNDDCTTENILVTPRYENGALLTTLQNVGNDYRIKLNVQYLNETNNYNLDFIDAVVYLTVNKKAVTVKPGNPYYKPIDGTDRANITSENYILEGLIEKDIGMVDIEFTATLANVLAGQTVVRMAINKLIGSIEKDNYELQNTNIEIEAHVQTLAKVTMNNYTIDFDNEEQSIPVVIENALDGVTYEVQYLYLDGTVVDGNPINAGTYNANCIVHLGDYQETMATAKITINKILPSLYLQGNFKQTYGSFTPITAVVEAVGLRDNNIAVHYSFEEEGETFPRFPEAGSHIVSAIYEESDNYLEIRTEATLKIAKKDITVTFDNFKGLVYNGYTRNDDITVKFNGVVEGDICEPIKIYNVEQVKNAGSYSLAVNPSNDSYMISGTRSINFTIAKKNLYVSVGNDTVAEFGTKPQFTIKYEGFVENEDAQDLAVQPSVKLTSGIVGTNFVEYLNGNDENYSFVYAENTYNIIYVKVDEDKPNYTPYIVIGAAVGGIVLIFVLGYLIKIYNYSHIASGLKKREIRNAVMNKKK